MPVSKANNCVSCGALLTGPIKAGKITCTFCGSVNVVNQDQREEENYCPHCHAANAPGSRHCSECGELLIINCPKCGTPNHTDVRFCGKCGEDLQKKKTTPENTIQPSAPAQAAAFSPVPVQVARHTSSLAVISLISGIASFVIAPVIFSIVGIITGGMAKKEIKNGRGLVDGGGMATAGVVMSYISLVLGLIVFCILILMMPAIMNSTSGY